MINFLKLGSILTLFSVPFLINTANAKFNHTGVQVGKTLEGCYHNPCSIGKVKQFKILQKSPNQVMLELTILGGSREFNSRKITWNKKPHKAYVTCSKSKPSIGLEGEVDVVPLNPEFVPGMLYNSAQYYLQACHNYYGSAEDGAKRFGYNVSF
ncbi:hypothetical protein [Moraxella porci]|uniref:hypothetical protein n=1 Tax=Moraxella porci TaxID=1288392 RepID=UPI0024488628|nr:hypothetical protein [Moraxella porci]MDH2274042.1 hypothetical protein [Moraxella porci]